MSSLEAENLSNKANYHHGNLRETLLNAGLAYLEKNEAESLSFREMARQVGVSGNAVYRHFESKDAFLVALAAKGFRQLMQAQSQAVKDVVPQIHAFKMFGLAYINFAKSNPNLFALMFDCYSKMKDENELSDAVQQSLNQLYSVAASFLGLDENDPKVEIQAKLCFSLVHGMSHLWLEGILADGEEKADHLSNMILNYLGDLFVSHEDNAK